MALTPKQIVLFGKLHTALVEFAEGELKALLPPVSKGKTKEDVSQRIIAFQDALQRNPHVIDKFVRLNPASLSSRELAEVASWKDARTGGFFVLKHLARHSIFMGADDDYTPRDDVYAVSSISEPFTKVVGDSLPVFVRTVLLPFQGKIVFDGFLQSWQVDLGDEVRRMLLGCYQYIRKTSGIITTLEPDTTRKSQPGKPRNSAAKRDD